jgi:hypothetical protein
MTKKPDGTIQAVCPCCNAKLLIDAALGVVISHEAPPKAGPGLDLNDAAGILAEQNRQREDKFADSWFQEYLLAKKFEEAMKKAKDGPATKPIRDFDLD